MIHESVNMIQKNRTFHTAVGGVLIYPAWSFGAVSVYVSTMGTFCNCDTS